MTLDTYYHDKLSSPLMNIGARTWVKVLDMREVNEVNISYLLASGLSLLTSLLNSSIVYCVCLLVEEKMQRGKNQARLN